MGLDPRLSNLPVLSVQNAFIQGQGILVNANENESIVITDIIARNTGHLREDTGAGDIIITIPVSGHSNLVTPIQVSAGASIYNDAPPDPRGVITRNQVSINYYKVRV
jgi:hypothetical protein